MKITPETFKKRLVPLILICAIAFGSGFMVFNYISNNSARLEKEYSSKYSKDLVEVIVAGSDLPIGSVISNQTMAVRKIPKRFLPTGHVQPDAVSQYFGRKLITSMNSGSPLSSVFLEDTVATPFSTKIQPGLRALTISVDEINSISGLLRAGDRLDLYLTTRSPAFKDHDGKDDQVVFSVIQNLLVHATGQLTKEETDNRNKLMAENSNVTRDRYSTITVAVSQEDAQRLIMAQQVGKITAVLRNASDSGGESLATTARSLYEGAFGVQAPEEGVSVTYLVGGGGIKRSKDIAVTSDTRSKSSTK